MTAPLQLRTKDVIAAVAHAYDLPAAMLRGERRWPTIAQARAVAMYVARKLTNESYPTIGREFRKHHTTVITAVRRIEACLKTDAALRAMVEQVVGQVVRDAAPAGAPVASEGGC